MLLVNKQRIDSVCSKTGDTSVVEISILLKVPIKVWRMKKMMILIMIMEYMNIKRSANKTLLAIT